LELDEDDCPGSFILWQETSISIEQDTGWASEPVWVIWRRQKSLIPAGYRVSKCSLCFVHCVDSRFGRFFYIIYLFWSLDNR